MKRSLEKETIFMAITSGFFSVLCLANESQLDLLAFGDLFLFVFRCLLFQNYPRLSLCPCCLFSSADLATFSKQNISILFSRLSTIPNVVSVVLFSITLIGFLFSLHFLLVSLLVFLLLLLPLSFLSRRSFNQNRLLATLKLSLLSPVCLLFFSLVSLFYFNVTHGN